MKGSKLVYNNLESERKELDNKIMNLSKFLKREQFLSLDGETQDLLLVQFKVMQSYSDILLKRMNLLR